MLKYKIYFTIFVVYEIIAVILLHDMYTCHGMFGTSFCADSGFKYVLCCVGIPLLALVIALWIDQIVSAHRRRHSFLHRAGNIVSEVASGVKAQVGHAFESRDIDKYLAAAILFGIKKYSDAHPQIRRTVHDIMDAANNHNDMHFDTGADYNDDTDDGIDNKKTRGAGMRSANTTLRSNTSRRTGVSSRSAGNMSRTNTRSRR